MAWLSRPSARINYEVWSPNDVASPRPSPCWVTLVNGHTRPLNDFRLLGRSLVELGYSVLALDNRGAGKTEATAPFSLEDMAKDVEALWDELHVGVTRLAGVSMGGFISQILTHRQKERVERLVLVSTAPAADYIQRTSGAWSTDPALVEAKLLPYFTESFAERNATLVKSMVKQIAKAVEEGRFQESSAMQMQATETFDLLSLLPEITCPTLVIHGKEDRIIPYAAAETMARLLPNARLVGVQNAGHLLLAEAPALLKDEIKKFFGA